ncbi:hypothetical protein A3K71_00260 [archaeon RBG_16_50_20]|nr:MAG: hypothetical protein A3K71_00260 [archaeon RBG_16_50_20]
MFFQLTEFPVQVWISGFKNRPDNVDATLRSIQEKSPDVTAQLVDLGRVPGSRYMLLAVLNALKSFHSKQPIARSLGMEILLYIAASRQIGEAIQRVGISSSTEKIVGILVGTTRDELLHATKSLARILNQKSDDDLIDNWSPDRIRNVQSIFEIRDMELKATLRAGEAKTKAIERLATERSALLTVRK